MTIINMVGGGGGGDEGLLPISQPVVTGVAEHGKNCLKLNDPDDDCCRGTQLTCWECSTVVRKLGSNPTSKTDGTVIFTSTTRDQCASTYYVDTGLTNGCTYHYRAFSDVTVGLPSCSNVLCLTPTAGAMIDVMLVGGGGSGGGSTASSYYCCASGGGGGGQVVICCGLSIGQTTTVTIGQGGNPGYSGQNTGGGNTVVGSVTAYGGGAGGGSESGGGYGGNGGGGGGAYAYCKSGGSGCTHKGGCGYGGYPGGGGGAGADGCNGCSDTAGAGGAGCTTTFTGKSETFAGGGGAGGGNASRANPAASGGSGGGGAGGAVCRYGNDATFYGGGGGGAGQSYQKYGGAGYQGLAVIRYLISCGYTITGGQCCYTCNGYKYHCFTSSGTITVA